MRSSRVRRCCPGARLGFLLLAASGWPGCGQANDPAPGASTSWPSGLGDLVFDSNRSGTFGIYCLASPHGSIHPLVDGPAHEMFPAPSPDGRWIAYARSDSSEPHRSSAIWICRRDGSEARLLAAPGTFPTFSADGTTVYFEQARSRLMAVPVAGGEPALVFPREGQGLPGTEQVKPVVSPDGTYAAFIVNAPRTWHVWIAEVNGAGSWRIAQGCEPAWAPDGKTLYYIGAPRYRERTAICRVHIDGGKREVVQDEDAPWGHEYFPSPSPDGRWLAWGACPPGQHDHEHANYQLFVRDVTGGPPRRLTHDRFTNRWPRFLPD